ncbi:hypothetical protein IKE97_02695 [Candidatus Saccharibacteria bacterium]|nr:hypothetical protein [Candidatus Saccharibacteria bacterium]
MVKKGDTLIEVTLAVGIFSMIAIAIVAVMSSGTSNAQLSLETTLAREEIDTQAEALRFIQSSYLANRDSADNRYTKLWKKITDPRNVLDAKSLQTDDDAKVNIFNFTPTNCKELYNSNSTRFSNIKNQKAFIINPRKFDTFTANQLDSVVSYYEGSGIFRPATTYPHLIFNTAGGNKEEGLINTFNNTTLNYAEGIYVIAVKDAGTTSIVDQSGSGTDDTKKSSAFYDFYIRTCWYGTDAEHPSTISTVMRLYDPDVVSP